MALYCGCSVSTRMEGTERSLSPMLLGLFAAVAASRPAWRVLKAVLLGLIRGRCGVAASRPAWRVLKGNMMMLKNVYFGSCSVSTRMEGTESAKTAAAFTVLGLVAASRPAWRVLKVRLAVYCADREIRCSVSTRMEGTESPCPSLLAARPAWLQRLDPHGGY